MVQKIAVTLLLCAVSFFAEGQILVTPNGSGNGKSWAQPMDLQSALSSANFGIEIWLRAGTYRPVQCNACTDADRKISFVIPDGVKVLGGFAGIETRSDQRNWKQNPTIFSGDIDSDGTLSNNSYSVVFTENVSELTLVDGITIRHGNASGDDEILEKPRRSGGGWYNGGIGTPQSNPTIRNCTFENNDANGFGGAMYNMGGFEGQCAPTYENCLFKNNKVRFDGASLYNNGSFGGSCNFTMTDCRFEDNLAGWEVGGGAAMFNNGIEGVCNPVLTNCTFIRQLGTLHGGAIYNQGKSGDASPTLTNCVFYKNEAIQAGAMYNLGVLPGGKSNPIVTNCTFYGNVAYDFGGACTVNGDVTGESRPFFRNCIFWDNVGEVKGDIFYQINGHPTLQHCLVDKPDCESMISALSNLSTIECDDGMLYEVIPKFADAANADMRLKHNSGGIDMGMDSFHTLAYDHDYQDRIALNGIDIGAFEYNGHPPTRMESFSASTNDNFVKLDWVSQTEYLNAGFEIQRSRDSIDWEAVSWVNSQGNKNRRSNYSAFDVPPQRGEVYAYRLRQVDTDSCFRYFGLDTAFIRPNEVLVKLFPSPTERFTTLKIYYPREDVDNNYQVFLTNLLGQVLITEKEEDLSKGWTTINFDLINVASGVHYFYVFANGREVVLPVVLTRY